MDTRHRIVWLLVVAVLLQVATVVFVHKYHAAQAEAARKREEAAQLAQEQETARQAAEQAAREEEEKRRAEAELEANCWKNVNVTEPPPYFPWHKWGSYNSSEAQGMAFDVLLEALVLLDGSPPDYYDYDVLILRKGILYRPQVKVDTLLRERGPDPFVRFAIMQRSISQALSHLYPYRHTQPRFRALYEDELPFLIRNGDDTHCGDLDFLGRKSMSRLPTLQWCREVTCPYSWPIVSYHLFDVFWHMHADEWDNQMRDMAERYPWHNKTRKAFWRGALTGESFQWRTENARVKMVRIANQHPHIMDVGFVSNDQIPGKDKEEWSREFQIVDLVERVDQQQFVAIIDIDGNSWSSRFSNQLCLNSVTIKVEAHWEDYFYPELQPWVHFIPANGNLTNLVEIVEYVLDEKNAAQIQSIIKNANAWCKSKLTRQQMSIDFLWMLVAYSESFDRYDPKWRGKWKSDKTAYLLPHLNMTAVDPNMTIERNN